MLGCLYGQMYNNNNNNNNNNNYYYYYYYYYLTPLEFFSRTRFRILAVLSNAVVWIVSTRPPTSKSSRPFNNPLVIVPNAPITIGTIVSFMFHSFFNSLPRSRYLSFFSLSFRFILWPLGQQSRQFCRFSLFFCWLLWGLVFWPGLGDPFVY